MHKDARYKRTGAIITTIAVVVLTTTLSGRSEAADLGIHAKKFAIRIGRISQVDAKSSAILDARNDPGIQKGPGGDPALLSARLAYEWVNDAGSSVFGCFTGIDHKPPFPWEREWGTNNDAVAKFRNRNARHFSPHTKSVQLVTGRVLRWKASRLADQGKLRAADDGPPTANGGVTVMFELQNGVDGTTHRMCTTFSSDAGSIITYKNELDQFGLKYKMIAKNGFPAPCPPWPCP